MRRLWLDLVIGWNSGAAIRRERAAEKARLVEATARDEYRRRYLTWS